MFRTSYLSVSLDRRGRGVTLGLGEHDEDVRLGLVAQLRTAQPDLVGPELDLFQRAGRQRQVERALVASRLLQLAPEQNDGESEQDLRRCERAR